MTSGSVPRVSVAESAMSALRQIAVGELHGNGPLANGGRDTLHRLMAHVAGAEYTGYVRLEQIRITRERPAARLPVLLLEIRTRKNEPVVVALDDIGDPLRAWLGTGEGLSAGHVEGAIGDARRDEERARRQLGAVGQREDAILAVDA